MNTRVFLCLGLIIPSVSLIIYVDKVDYFIWLLFIYESITLMKNYGVHYKPTNLYLIQNETVTIAGFDFNTDSLTLGSICLIS